MEKGLWSTGYSMQFEVSESLKGNVGPTVTVETGNGGGDCGTPLPPGKQFFVFANEKDGKLWTGMCMGNWALDGDASDEKRIAEYRQLTSSPTGSIFGRILQSQPIWKDDDLEDRNPKPMAGLTLHAKSQDFTAVTTTAADGSYSFHTLPNGAYTIVPDIDKSLDFDHEYEDRYQAHVSQGGCAQISFRMQPSMRIRGHISIPAVSGHKLVEVEAVPVSTKKLNQFSGKWDFTDEKGNFDLWPLPPGDYYVGVNITGSPKADSPFLPTYYPGVTKQAEAQIIHLAPGEIRDLELSLDKAARSRTVHFTAIGLDGKALKTVYVQLEDLRHPGDAASYVNVPLDNAGAGTMTVYAGFDYHLHASHWVSYQNDWCAKAVGIAAGEGPVEARFVMDRKSDNCWIDEIDGRKR